MKPRYAVVNDEERKEFESFWQMPYGYSKCPVFEEYEQAQEFFKNDLKTSFSKDIVDKFVIEEYNNGERNVVFLGR